MKMRLSSGSDALVLRRRLSYSMDEPLSAVDELTSEVVARRRFIITLEEGKFTAILVTHNVSEAVYLPNRSSCCVSEARTRLFMLLMSLSRIRKSRIEIIFNKVH